MRVLITGAMGNLGGFAVPELLARGVCVRSFDVPSKPNLGQARRYGTSVEFFWGDVRNAAQVERATQEVDVVVHLAGIIPPLAHERPDLAEAVNVGGTRHVYDAALAQSVPPKVLLASSFDVFGPTTHLEPPRIVSDPLVASDNYSEHKIQAERALQATSLTWAVYRLADMPVLGPRTPHPMMFDIPLNTRMEVLHPSDAAVAIAEGIVSGAIWNEVWLIGGAPACQVTYEQYLTKLLGAMGLPMLPAAAFGTRPYCTDWLDTRASQELLHYQQHTFDAIVAEISKNAGLLRYLAAAVAPLAGRRLLRMSSYYRAG